MTWKLNRRWGATVGASHYSWPLWSKGIVGLWVLADIAFNWTNDRLWCFTGHRLSLINSRWGRSTYYYLAGQSYPWGDWP